MELDERLRWIETRVTSSLKPRAEELKHLFTNEESRSVADSEIYQCEMCVNFKGFVQSVKFACLEKSSSVLTVFYQCIKTNTFLKLIAIFIVVL